MKYYLTCVSCHTNYKGYEIRYRCSECGEILEVLRSDGEELKRTISSKLFEDRWKSKEFPYLSGVWRYKELVLPIDNQYIITRPEGNTNLYLNKVIGQYAGLSNLYLKHEGENPTGSFKDRGMTVGISTAKSLKVKAVACASTGNTSSSLASYAALAGLKCFVFLPRGKLSTSKLAQSIAYGAYNLQIDGDFDEAMELVEKICQEYNIYLLNSLNPFRLEGQKTILFEILQQLNWRLPDWIVLPGGNLGNTSAIGKALFELKDLGIIQKLPQIAVIQAHGANPFYKSFQIGFKKRFKVQADTLASAIRIGNPVSFLKAKRVIEKTNGIVEEVKDQEILAAKAIIDKSGLGCEPASAATLAGLKKLVTKKIIQKENLVVGILTGHLLKDPDTVMKYQSNNVIAVDNMSIEKKIKNLL